MKIRGLRDSSVKKKGGGKIGKVQWNFSPLPGSRNSQKNEALVGQNRNRLSTRSLYAKQFRISSSLRFG